MGVREESQRGKQARHVLLGKGGREGRGEGVLRNQKCQLVAVLQNPQKPLIGAQNISWFDFCSRRTTLSALEEVVSGCFLICVWVPEAIERGSSL